jgi:tetratricopeptide (TPR) repeat protein
MRDRFLFAGIIIITLCSCSSSPFRVKTEPVQATISYIDSKTEQKQLLGQSPFEIPYSELKTKLGEPTAGEYFTVVIEKEGFLPQTLSVPVSSFGVLVTEVNVKLKQGQAENELKIARDILDHLFLAQKFALTKQYERAQIEIDQILKQFPKFARALSMRGSILMAENNLRESLKWFEKAIEADPQMEETVKLAAKVRAQLGVVPRAPAGQPAAGAPPP